MLPLQRARLERRAIAHLRNRWLDQHTIKELPKPPVDGRARGSIEQAIDAVVVAANFDAQIQAIRELGNFQDPRTIKVLGPALHSHVTEVRKAALEAMREGTVEDKATLADVRYAVTNDADPEVRQAALEVLVRYDESPEAKKVLEKLASDPRGPHREQARRELARMEYEADARSRPDTQLQAVQQRTQAPNNNAYSGIFGNSAHSSF